MINPLEVPYAARAFRQVWLRHDEDRKKALLDAKVGRGVWQCAICLGVIHNPYKPEVDHIIAVGSFKDDFFGAFRRLFCPASDLRILCKPCHAKVTKEQRSAARREKVPGSVQKPRKNAKATTD